MLFVSERKNYMDNPLLLIKAEVAYAKPNTQRVIEVELQEGSTVEQAIHVSAILNEFPEIDLMQCGLGVFSKKVTLTTVVANGDRVEIYRPLIIDPKEARFIRVNKK